MRRHKETAMCAHRDPKVRLLALGGFVGPIAFVGSWAIAGATTAHYSAVDNAISDLAAVHARTRVAMTVGFVVFGLGVIAFGLALRAGLPGRAWMAAIATGACTIGVAATPLGGWPGAATHAAFAGLGYATLVALPLLAAAPLTRAGHLIRARLSVLTGAVSATCLASSTLGPAHGLWQRLGLTTGDVWIVATASAIAAGAAQTRYAVS
jgi:uncharacterized protein DUF998